MARKLQWDVILIAQKLFETTQVPVEGIAVRVGMTPNTIYRWRRRFRWVPAPGRKGFRQDIRQFRFDR